MNPMYAFKDFKSSLKSAFTPKILENQNFHRLLSVVCKFMDKFECCSIYKICSTRVLNWIKMLKTNEINCVDWESKFDVLFLNLIF